VDFQLRRNVLILKSESPSKVSEIAIYLGTPAQRPMRSIRGGGRAGARAQIENARRRTTGRRPKAPCRR
jgi:hypothetical protein